MGRGWAVPLTAVPPYLHSAFASVLEQVPPPVSPNHHPQDVRPRGPRHHLPELHHHRHGAPQDRPPQRCESLGLTAVAERLLGALPSRVSDLYPCSEPGRQGGPERHGGKEPGISLILTLATGCLLCPHLFPFCEKAASWGACSQPGQK